LFKSDSFSFGQQIGPLTNLCTSIYAMLPLFDENSEEYKVLISRIKQCCVNQSKQIDKTKIGQDVKCIPDIWTKWQHINDDDTPEIKKQKEFFNRIIVEKKPYFFKYKYKTLSKELNEYLKKYKENAELRFGKPLDQIINTPLEDRTPEENDFLYYYYKYFPAIDTNCVMNKVCHYIESVNFHVKEKVRSSSGFDYKVLVSENFTINKDIYEKIKNVVETTFKEWNEKTKSNKNSKIEQSFAGLNSGVKNSKDADYLALKTKLEEITVNEKQIANHLVYLFYVEHPNYNKATLWRLVGKQLYENIKEKHKSFNVPVKDKNGSIKFLHENYQVVNLPISHTAREE